MKTIRATFKGRNGSLGYIKNKEYTFVVTTNKILPTIGETGICEYESVESFLNNWDNIKVL